MRGLRRALFLFLAVPLASCSLLGSVTDRSMEHAPFSACTRFGHGPGEGPQCLVMVERRPDGSLSAFARDTVRAGDELLATLSAAPQCQGNFTHVMLAGNAAGPGALHLAVPDAFGRGDVGRDLSLGRGRAASLDSEQCRHAPCTIPAGLRIAVARGRDPARSGLPEKLPPLPRPRSRARSGWRGKAGAA